MPVAAYPVCISAVEEQKMSSRTSAVILGNVEFKRVSARTRSALKAAVISVIGLGGLQAFPSHANAASYSWDPQQTNNGAGGTGTWNSTNTNWFNGTSDVLWPGTGNVAVFSGTAGTSTLGATEQANGLLFATTGYILDLNSHALTIDSAGTVYGATTGTTMVANTGNGGTGLTFSGASQATLGFAAASTGTLAISANITGSTTANLIFSPNGGALNLSGGATFASTTNGTTTSTNGAVGKIFFSGGTYNFNSTGNDYQNGVVGETVTIAGGTVIAKGRFLLDHSSNSGTMNLNSGEFDTAKGIGSDASISGNVVNFAGATFANTATLADILDLTGGGNTSANFTLNDGGGGGGAVIKEASALSLTIPEVINHTGSGADGGVTLAGGGSLVLSGANAFTGGVNVQQGTLTAATSGTALGSATAAAGLSLNPTGSNIARVNITAATATVASLASSGTGASTVILGNSTTPAASALTIGNASNLSATFGGVISDLHSTAAAATGSIIKVGTGTEILTGSNTYTGVTTVSAGGLTLGSGGGLGTTNVTVASGATFAAAPGTLGATNTAAGNLTLSAGSNFSMADSTTSTLNVIGSANLGASNTLLTFDLGGTTTAADQLVVSGAATFSAAGSTIAVQRSRQTRRLLRTTPIKSPVLTTSRAPLASPKPQALSRWWSEPPQAWIKPTTPVLRERRSMPPMVVETLISIHRSPVASMRWRSRAA
jgi:fibronectin-binding autotransporter adhesin